MQPKIFKTSARHHNWWRFAPGLVCLAVGFIPAWAQTPDQLIQLMMSQPKADISAPVTATASFDPPLVRPGEKSIYRVTFNATSDATAVAVRWPEPMPAPAPLTLRLVASGHNMQPTGGAMQTFSTFNFDAQSKAPGTFKIPPFTVDVYGRPVLVPAAQLEVRTAVPEPHEPARQLFLEPSATNVFVGETFNVSVLLPGGPGNRIEAVSQVELTGDGFIMQRNPIRQAIQMLERGGRKTPTFIYETTVTPMSTGRLELAARGYTAGMQFGGPVTITGQATIPGGPPQYVLLNSESVTINVRPLPTGSELPGFTGAVGSYTCDPPTLATNQLKVGDTVELKVVIRGRQNLERIIPPASPRVQDWQIFPAVRGPIVSGPANPGASFTYTLVPLTTNSLATPAIPFSCFDPVSGKYVDLTIPPVPVTVLTGGAVADADATLMLSENADEDVKKSSLSRLASSPGRRTSSLVPLQMRAWFPVVQLLPVLAFIGLWFWGRRRRHLEQHPEIARRRGAKRALRRELHRLDRAAATGDTAGFIRCGINALQIASAPHYPAAPQALVCRDVLEILTATERAGKSGEIIRRFFTAADASAFALAAEANAELFAEKLALKEILAKLEARL